MTENEMIEEMLSDLTQHEAWLGHICFDQEGTQAFAFAEDALIQAMELRRRVLSLQNALSHPDES